MLDDMVNCSIPEGDWLLAALACALVADKNPLLVQGVK